MAKTRSSYDAPFTRDLVSFDCAVTFDWTKHFVDLLGTMPASAVPVAQRLQMIQHRVFVDRTGAQVSAIPQESDLSGIAHAAELEQALKTMIAQGLNAWTPFSTNVILPVEPTKYKFDKIDVGYKLTMDGPGISAILLLDPDLRVTSGVSQLPQPLRFATEFSAGTDGFLLSSVRTGSTTDGSTNTDATFAFTYQSVQNFQLPQSVTVTPGSPEKWQYTLTDCKAMKGIYIQTGLPKR